MATSAVTPGDMTPPRRALLVAWLALRRTGWSATSVPPLSFPCSFGRLPHPDGVSTGKGDEHAVIAAVLPPFRQSLVLPETPLPSHAVTLAAPFAITLTRGRPVATTRKGFNRERHTALKVAFAGTALGGFSLAWAGFASSHPPVAPAAPLSVAAPAVLQVPTTTPTPARPPAAPSPTPVTSPPATSTPTPTPNVAVDASATPATPAATTHTSRR